MKPDNQKRIHDLNTVHMDFKILLNLIKAGYRFDDKDAQPLINQLAIALEILKREISILEIEEDSTKNSN